MSGAPPETPVRANQCSARQLFLGTESTLFVLDKVENNAAQLNGHPAWAARYDLRSNKGQPMDVITNTFCAVRLRICCVYAHGAAG